MNHPICTTCGVQYRVDDFPPLTCPICEDERQYVNPDGQNWTTLEDVNRQYENTIELVAPQLYAIYTKPTFAIGQRAHLLITPHGNILWDCITNLDDYTIAEINKLGGIKAIAISHPHYYSTMVAWSHAFGFAPIYIHQLDAQWLGRHDAVIQLWDGHEHPLWSGIKIVLCGGHFEGGAILHVPMEKGMLLVGDVIQVCPDRKTVSFMYSYPNYIPLSARAVTKIQETAASLNYDALYGAFGRYIGHGAKDAMDYSIRRYLHHIR